MAKYKIIIDYGVRGPNYNGFTKYLDAKDLDSLRKKLVSEYGAGLVKWNPTFIDVYTLGSTGKPSRSGMIHAYGRKKDIHWATKNTATIYVIDPKTGKLRRD